MKCPNCKNKMEKGQIGAPGKWEVEWRSSNSLMGTLLGIGGKTILAYKCSKCGKVELTTKTGK